MRREQMRSSHPPPYEVRLTPMSREQTVDGTQYSLNELD